MGVTGSVAMAGISYISSENQASAMTAQGMYQNEMMQANAGIADLQAEDAIKRGDAEANRYGSQVRSVIGSQRANFSGQGVDVNKGSALETQVGTAEVGAQDQVTIKNNAWMEAWGYRAGAADMRRQGQLAMMGANNNSRNTLMAGGLNAINNLAGAYGNYRQGNYIGGTKKRSNGGGGNNAGGSYNDYGNYT